MKSLKYIILLVLAVQFVSCSEDFLERSSKGAPSTANFWKSDADAIIGTNAIYSRLDEQPMYGRGYMWLINANDDMIDGRNKGVAAEIKNFTTDGNISYLNRGWKDRWLTIKLCNDVIRSLKTAEAKELISDEVRNNCLGQAYFISAWTYIELAYRFGDDKMGIPILNEEDPLDYFVPREKNVQVNYDYAMDLLKKAESLLPYLTDMPESELGRAHKDAAYAYMTKIAIYTEQWDDAITYANKVINSPSGRALIDTDTPEKDYLSVFSPDNNTSSEYIWSIVSNQYQGSILPGVMLENKAWGKYNGWGYFQPTKDLDDEFEAGDFRRKATLITDGDTMKNFFGEDFVWHQSSNNLTGYMFSKYLQPFLNESPIGNTINSNGNAPSTTLWIPMLRFSEIILWKAEAKLMKGQNADAEINMIRDRAGLAPKSNCTMDDLKHERRCEFGGEFTDRHFDLVRWGDAEATYAKPLHGMKYTYDENGALASSEEVEVWGSRTFKPQYHHIWPIPPTQIEKSIGTKGELIQNEGW